MTNLEFFGSVGVVFAVQAAAKGLSVFVYPSKTQQSSGTRTWKRSTPFMLVHLLALLFGGIVFFFVGGDFGDVGIPLAIGNLLLLYGLTALSAAALSAIRVGLSALLTTRRGRMDAASRLFFFLVGIPGLAKASSAISLRASLPYSEYASVADLVLAWVLVGFGILWMVFSLLPRRFLSTRLCKPRFSPLVLLTPFVVHLSFFVYFFTMVYCMSSLRCLVEYYLSAFVISICVMVGGFVVANYLQGRVFSMKEDELTTSASEASSNQDL